MSIPYDDNEILKWFVEYLIDNDSIPQEYIDELLKTHKPYMYDPQTIQLFEDILSGKVNKTRENMAFLNVSQALSLVNKDSNTLLLEILYDYHAVYNKEFLMDVYGRLISRNIGKKVMVQTAHPNEFRTVSGKLKDYKAQESITIEEKKESLIDDTVILKENVIPFVGFKSYIKEVRNNDQELLYINKSTCDPDKLIEDADIQTVKDNLFSDKKIEGPIR